MRIQAISVLLATLLLRPSEGSSFFTEMRELSVPHVSELPEITIKKLGSFICLFIYCY